jgi:hypothetical protein
MEAERTMVDPKNAREVAIDLAGFKAAVAPQFSWLNQLIYWLGAVMLAMVGGGFALWSQIGDMKGTTGRIEEKVTAIGLRLTKLEEAGSAATAVLTKLDQASTAATALLNRIDTQIANLSSYSGPLMLSQSDVQVITTSLGISKTPGKEPTKVRLGDIMPSDALKEFPNSLVAKLPKLKGTKYTVDSGSVIIADSENRVIAVVTPT